jgi:transcriptional regulator with XRE-family HTH domain
MMGKNRRQKPARLAEKLLALRQGLGLSQSQLGRMLGFTRSFNRVSQYENGINEPNLLILLAYAKVARVRVEVLIDDKQDLPKRFTREQF